jgi:hypothetical protein
MARAAKWILCRRAAPSADREVQPIGVPVAGFDTKEAAETERKRLERAARESATVGPNLQRLPPERGADLVAAAKAIGLPPLDLTAVGPEVKPKRTHGGYTTYTEEYAAYCNRMKQAVTEWWSLVAADLDPAKNAALWDALFPDVNFYLLGRVLFE